MVFVYPFWVGIDKPTEWESEPPPVTVNGKTYTYYQATQEQRRREREIRNLKRNLYGYEAAGMSELAQETKSLIRAKTTEYKKFSQAVNIRAKLDRLRVCEGRSKPYDTAKDNGITKSEVDWISAHNLANGNVRLTNMLRSGDVQKTGEAINEILNSAEYGFRRSKWSGKMQTSRVNDMKNAIGQKEWSCDITIREDNLGNLKTYIHENLHSRSISYCDSEAYLRYRALEEGSVEYMAQQICQKAGVSYTKSYHNRVNALRRIHSFLFSELTEYDFAKFIFDIAPEERYTYIKERIDKYPKQILRMKPKNKHKLDEALKELS